MLLEVGQLFRRKVQKAAPGDENGGAEQGGRFVLKVRPGGGANMLELRLIPFSMFLVLQVDGGGLSLMFDGRGRDVEDPADKPPPPAWTLGGGSYPPPHAADWQFSNFLRGQTPQN